MKEMLLMHNLNLKNQADAKLLSLSQKQENII